MFVKVEDKENKELIVVNTDQITLMAICADGAFVLVPEKGFAIDKPSYNRIMRAMELENLIKCYTLQVAPIDFLADYKEEVKKSCKTCIKICTTYDGEERYFECWEPKEELK